jgi:hypothetical protein
MDIGQKADHNRRRRVKKVMAVDRDGVNSMDWGLERGKRA